MNAKTEKAVNSTASRTNRFFILICRNLTYITIALLLPIFPIFFAILESGAFHLSIIYFIVHILVVVCTISSIEIIAFYKKIRTI